MPNREYFLMECGAGSDWRGLSGAEIVARWREFEKGGRHEEAFARVLEENARLSGASFQHVYDQRWGLDGSLGYDDAFADRPGAGQPGLPRRHG